MNLEDLKDEIVKELANLSGFSIQPCITNQVHGSWTTTPGGVTRALPGACGNEYFSWGLVEDNSQVQESTWLKKEVSVQEIGKVILQETKLYFEPGLSSERIFLSDLVDPESFDKAIKQLTHALAVARSCKNPMGILPPPRFRYE